MNKIIAFLGDEELKPTSYCYEGKHAGSTRYLLTALASHFYPGYAIRLLCTPEAERRHLMDLRRDLGDEAARRLQIIPVQRIATESDLWDIFQVIQRQVDDGDDIVFDITHSFRALPFLAFLALAYLRVIRKFTIVAIIYAPYAQYEKSEVYNISEFMELLDWIIAANLFTKTGFAAPMADLLQGHDWGSSKANPADLERVTAALRLARPDEARQAAYALAQSLTDIESDAPPSQLRPFEALLDRIKTEFAQIAPTEPDPNVLRQELEQELAFVSWNIKRGQLMSAVTVAREWLVSLVFYLDKNAAGENWRDGDQRDIAEKKVLKALKELAILDASERTRQMGQKSPRARSLWERDPVGAKALGHAWDLIANLRNDLNHAGKIVSTSPRSLHDVLNEAEQVPGLLRELASLTGLS